MRLSMPNLLLLQVNRSQREIQKSIGAPAQLDTIECLFKDVNHRLEGLDQRLEALNAVSLVFLLSDQRSTDLAVT